MIVTKVVVGQNVTITVDGSKFTKRFIDKIEKSEFIKTVEEFIAKIEKSKSDKAIDKLKHSLINLFTVKTKEVTKKEELKEIAAKKITKKLEKVKIDAPSNANFKELEKQVKLLQKSIEEKDEIIKKLQNNDKKVETVTAPEPRRYRGER